MPKTTLVLALAVAFAVPATVRAGLAVGDKAPPISIKKWMKGEAIDPTKLDKDQIVVVEFWATWCGPCVASMPHMSKIQSHFKDQKVTIVGVSDETDPVVTKFLTNGGSERMQYTVALDDDEKTNKAYMKAAGQNGIPCAFLIKGGKIEWIGHPMDGLDKQIAKLCGDKKYLENIEKIEKLTHLLDQAYRAEEWQTAIMKADELLSIEPDWQTKMMKFHIYSTGLKDAKKMSEWGNQIVNDSNTATELNEFAWTLLTERKFAATPDVKLARKAAKKAMDLSKSEDPAIIDTYARALFEDGDLPGAIEWQKKAVDACGDNKQMARGLKKTLKEYEDHRTTS